MARFAIGFAPSLRQSAIHFAALITDLDIIYYTNVKHSRAQMKVCTNRDGAAGFHTRHYLPQDSSVRTSYLSFPIWRLIIKGRCLEPRREATPRQLPSAFLTLSPPPPPTSRRSPPLCHCRTVLPSFFWLRADALFSSPAFLLYLFLLPALEHLILWLF